MVVKLQLAALPRIMDSVLFLYSINYTKTKKKDSMSESEISGT